MPPGRAGSSQLAAIPQDVVQVGGWGHSQAKFHRVGFVGRRVPHTALPEPTVEEAVADEAGLALQCPPFPPVADRDGFDLQLFASANGLKVVPQVCEEAVELRGLLCAGSVPDQESRREDSMFGTVAPGPILAFLALGLL